MGIWGWLTNKEPERKQMYTPLSPDLIQEHKAIVQENASLKAQIGLQNRLLKQEKEEERGKQQEQEVIKDLKEQEKDIGKNKFGRTISMRKFFDKVNKDSKFRTNLEFTDKDDNEVFGKFGDIQISANNGWLLATDENGNVLSYGPSISHIIYKPETFGNQIRRGRILLPRDKNLNAVIDLENTDVPDIVYDEETNEFRQTAEFRRKAVDLFQEKEVELQKYKSYVERLERAQVKQKRTIDDLKMAIMTRKNQVEISKSDLSQALNETTQIQAKMGDMQRNLALLNQMKTLHESMIDKLEGINKNLLTKMEKGGDKNTYELAMAEVQDLILFAKSNTPEVIYMQPEQPKENKQMPQPGQVLGNPGIMKGR